MPDPTKSPLIIEIDTRGQCSAYDEDGELFLEGITAALNPKEQG